MTFEDLKLQIQEKTHRLAYHGTAKHIAMFTERGVGRGADRNSALGLFLSEIPDNAAEYAHSAFEAGEGDQPRIYVVAIACGKIFETTNQDRFFGLDEDGIPTATYSDFSRWRRQLINEGYDAIDFEGGEDVISVCLSPQASKIVACLSYEQTLQIQEEGVPLFDSLALYRHLVERLPATLILPHTPDITYIEAMQP
jgi:hypothetical protein